MMPEQRKRGPGRFWFTYDDIARLVGLDRETVRSHAHGPGRQFNPRDLASVVRYIVARRYHVAEKA